MEQAVKNKAHDGEVVAQIKQLISVMKNCKKILTAENNFFEKNKTLDVSNGQDKAYSVINEFKNSYDKIARVRDLGSKAPENILETASRDYDDLMVIFHEYMINLEATSKIQEIIMGSIKHNASDMVQKDHGYNKKGKLANPQDLLSNMPSVAFNSKL